jgi:hypothetical protein
MKSGKYLTSNFSALPAPPVLPTASSLHGRSVQDNGSEQEIMAHMKGLQGICLLSKCEPFK